MVADNFALEKIDFTQLEVVNGNVTVSHNVHLSHAHLPSLTEVGDSFALAGNLNLESDGLDLSSLITILGPDLVVCGNGADFTVPKVIWFLAKGKMCDIHKGNATCTGKLHQC